MGLARLITAAPADTAGHYREFAQAHETASNSSSLNQQASPGKLGGGVSSLTHMLARAKHTATGPLNGALGAECLSVRKHAIVAPDGCRVASS